MSVDEWNALPWWQSTMYIEGLRDQGVLGKNDGHQPPPPGPGSSATPGQATSPLVDLTQDTPIPRGFTTRRAG